LPVVGHGRISLAPLIRSEPARIFVPDRCGNALTEEFVQLVLDPRQTIVDPCGNMTSRNSVPGCRTRTQPIKEGTETTELGAGLSR